ncbi:MutS-related protein [Cesiribacter andamanensis]|uniref:DNA mismatch repair protein mutS n=1 Tax=Cesiribacter andamanensis AMV16 TaxID=1279009 RepID=M7N952_9BACT|nr:DNA mismatch repair protein MutS [Cesiribacter andamanensis]EMR03736.1 DNA mismatch repair protein mutS [Cesiribacter andamanensis AMV16]
MTPHPPKHYFQEKLQHHQQATALLRNKVRSWATLRIVFFVLALILLFYLANLRYSMGVIGLLIVAPLIFAALIRQHRLYKDRLGISQTLTDINQQEIQRLHHKFEGLSSGQEHYMALHAYHPDLDVLGGRQSLFQLLNRAATPGGEAMLAYWLSAPAPVADIEARQQAARELAPLLDWRQEFLAQGQYHRKPHTSLDALQEWLQLPNVVLPRTRYRVAFATLPPATVLLILAFIFFDISFWWIIGAALVNALVVFRLAPHAKLAEEAAYSSLGLLKGSAGMFRMLEDTPWQSPYLQSLQASLGNGDKPKASARIRELSRILDGLESRSNGFYMVLNTLFLQDLYWMMQAERWKQGVQGELESWFKALYEWEALNSLAGLAFAEPDWAFPEVSTKPEHLFVAEALGHPLLAEGRVTNDFELRGRGEVILITGSNMAGKSTFLRTVGINAVLAQAGAPVCARRLHISRMQVFTSMRTQDSLAENVSSFYAELQRLRQLLRLLDASSIQNTSTRGLPAQELPLPPDAQPGLPVLFLLDEILKGTNSADRHKGAAALIRQLQGLNASGLISTHDLDLGQTASGAGLRNYSFNSEVVGQEIRFTYKLDPGICRSFNASALMAKMGIDVDVSANP